MAARLVSFAPRSPRSNRASLRTQSGFSMVELLIVISTMLIVSSIALLSFKTSTTSYRIKNDSRNLANLLNAARMKAAANFSRVVVYCDAAQTPVLCALNYYTFDNTTAVQTVKGDMKIYLSQGVSLAVSSAATYGVGGQAATTPSMTGTSVICGNTGATTPYCAIFNTRGLPVSSYSSASASAVSTYAFYLTDTSGNAMAVAVDISGRTNIYKLSGSTFYVLND